MCTIRKYDSKDQAAVEDICLGGGSGPLKSNEMVKQAMLTVYATYYVEQEPENCFVAADENDHAVGYVLCAKDFTEYEKKFMGEYGSREDNPAIKMIGGGTLEGMRPYAAEYPAHLHIDIDPAYQRKGLGTKLIDALRAHLKEQGVPGVMFGVAIDNEQGQNFYRKYGFTELGRDEQQIIMGMKLVD